MLKTALKKAFATLLACVFCASATLADETLRRIEVPGGDMVSALQVLERQSDVEFVYHAAQLRGVQTKGVSGTFTVQQAVRKLIEGTPLRMEVDAATGAMLISTQDTGAAHSSGTVIDDLRLAQSDTEPTNEANPKDVTSAAKTDAISEIVVTAQMREERLVDVPMSISVLSGDLVKDQRLTNLVDVSRLVPGMIVNDAGPGRRRIGLRGVGNTFGAQPLVGLYLDEIPVGGFNDAVIDLQTYDLERVEVLRGPQGTLYGEGSTSGTIRFITHKPDLDRTAVTANLKLLTVQDGDPTVDYDGAVNLPLVEDKLALRVAGRYLQGGGWIDQPLLGREDINDQDMLDLRTQLRWRVSERFTADALAVIHRNDAGAANRGEDAAGNYTQAFLEATTPSARDDFEIFNLTLSYDLGRVSIIGASSYIDIRKALHNDGNTIPLLAPPADPFQFLGRRQDSVGHGFSQELRLTSDTAGRLDYTLGGYYRDTQLNRFNDSVFGQDTASAFAFTQIANNGSKAWSVFGDGAYALTERLEIGTGLRYFVDERTYFDGAGQRGARFKSTTPRFYARYAANDSVSVYGNLAKGFRSGGFNVLGQPAYEPETLWSYELGVKTSVPALRLNADTTVFYSEYENVQVVGVTGASLGRSITSNLGEAWIKGIEGSVSFTLKEGLNLGVTGSIYRTRVTQIGVTGGSHQPGDTLDNVPKYSLSAWGDYARALTPNTTGVFQINYGRKGVSDYRNRSVGTFFFSQSDIVDLLNLSCGIERARWRFSVFADNVLNERGYMDAFSIEGSAARPQFRSFGISASLAL